MTVTLSNELPAYPTFVEGIRRAPDRGYRLTPAQTETALRNALRYIPEELHARLAPELWMNCLPGEKSMATVSGRKAIS